MPIDEIKLLFSKRLKEIMANHDKTQGDLVRDLNFRQATVSDWLNGKKYPRMDKIEKLAHYFGLSINELLSTSSPAPTLSLTQQEETFIKKYRQLDADGRERVDYVLDMEHKLSNERAEKEEQRLGYKEGIVHYANIRFKK